MRRRTLTIGLIPTALLALAGCSAGDPTYYRLAVWPGTPVSGGPSSVEIETPTVASFLDRDYIVSKTDGYELTLAGNRAWAEPIGEMIGNVLAGDLSQRLPGSNVYAQNSAISAAAPRARVSIEISRFDKDPGGQVVLQATLKVRSNDGDEGLHAPVVPILDRQMPQSPSTADMVASLSRMLGGVADRAATLLLRPPAPMPEPITPDGT